MEVTCPQCKTKLNIPDDRIPKDQTVRISCPRCKNRITVEPADRGADQKPENESLSKDANLHLKETVPDKKETADKNSGISNDFGGNDETLEFYDEGTKLALVMVKEEDHSDVKNAVEELGYRYVPVSNTREALAKLRFHLFDIVFLADGFDGQEVENSPITNYLRHLSMSSRRKIFFTILGDRFNTMDEMNAYAMSVNLVINPKDKKRLAAVLKRGISEYERFYKVFTDTLVELGKA